jgi:hypothetical protein
MAAAIHLLSRGAGMYTWVTREDGVIVVRDGDGPEQILTLSGPNGDLMERIEARWGDPCRRIGGRYGLRDGRLQAMIFRESGGNEHARSDDGGVGLGQITSRQLKGGFTDEQLEDPELNLEIMAKYVAHLTKIYGDDFPLISAAYNAGSVHPPYRGFENPWGLHCTRGHITAEVSALNYFLLRPLPAADRSEILAMVFSSNDDFLRHDLERGSTERPTTPNA